MKSVRKYVSIILILYTIFFLFYKSYPQGFPISAISFILGVTLIFPSSKYEHYYLNNFHILIGVIIAVFTSSILISFYLLNSNTSNIILTVTSWSITIFIIVKNINPYSEELIDRHKKTVHEKELNAKKAMLYDNPNYLLDSDLKEEQQNAKTKNIEPEPKPKIKTESKKPPKVNSKRKLQYLIIETGKVLLGIEHSTLKVPVFNLSGVKPVFVDLENVSDERSRFIVVCDNSEIYLCKLKSTEKKKIFYSNNIYGTPFKANFSGSNSYIFQTDKGTYKGYFNSTRKDLLNKS